MRVFILIFCYKKTKSKMIRYNLLRPVSIHSARVSYTDEHESVIQMNTS